MKTRLAFLAAFFMFSALINAQDTGAPDWINRPVSVENGLIVFVGYSEPLSEYPLTLQQAELNAQNNLIKKIEELSELPPIPPDVEYLSIFLDTINGRKVEGSISDISVLEIWEDDNGGVYVLCSCTGVALDREDTTQEKSLEEIDSDALIKKMESYFRASELELQSAD